MTDATSTGKDARIGVIALVQAALASARREALVLMAAGVGWTLVIVAVWFFGHLVDPSTRSALSALVTTLMSAVVLRVLLCAPAERWRVDARLAGYLILGALLAAGPAILGYSLIGSAPAPADRVRWAAQSSMFTVGAALVDLLLVLWPVGLLMDGPSRNPAVAIAGLRRGVLAFVGAQLLLAAPFFMLKGAIPALVYAMLDVRPGLDLARWVQLSGAPLAAAGGIVGTVLVAEFYRARYLANRGLGDLFA